MRVKVNVMNRYKRWMTLFIVILAVGASAPGCGKKGEEEEEALGGPGAVSNVINGFGNSGGQGQSGILSENTCHEVSRSSDGSVTFPIATSGSDPHYYSGGFSQGGYLYAVAYVASTRFTGGNAYSVQNSFNDNLVVNISTDDLYFNGQVYLAPATVRDILRYVGQDANRSTLCVDGVTFQQVLFSGASMSGIMTLWVNDFPVIYF